jgi:ELWxxDGT repeat protein
LLAQRRECARHLRGDAGREAGSVDYRGVEYHGRFFFGWRPDALPAQLWSSDGTLAGTGPALARAWPQIGWYEVGLTALRVVAGRLVFGVLGESSPGLWSTDGSDPGTTRIDREPIRMLLFVESSVELYGAIHSTLAYSDTSLSPQTVTLATDGTAAGTRNASAPPQRTPHRGRLYWISGQTGFPAELWSSDPWGLNAARVTVLSALTSGVTASLASTPRGLLILLATYSISETGKLWLSDGTPGGTTLIKTFASISGVASPLTGVASNTRVLFSAREPATGLEPYVYEGGPNPTRRIADIAPGTAFSSPKGFTRAGTRVFFSADDAVHGEELWVLDLREIGGALVEPIGAPCGRTAKPALTTVGEPVLGSFGFWLGVAGAPSSAAGILGLGLARESSTVLSCTWLVGVPVYWQTLVTSPSGAAAIPFPIPDDAAFLGIEAIAQCAFADGAAIAASNALRILIGSHDR